MQVVILLDSEVLLGMGPGLSPRFMVIYKQKIQHMSELGVTRRKKLPDITGKILRSDWILLGEMVPSRSFAKTAAVIAA